METRKFAEIIDKGECLSTINVPPAVNILDWSGTENIKHLAGKNEWTKHDFYPSNGLIGEIAGVLYNTIWGYDVYILKIQNQFYVPMSPNGIKFISENEMRLKQPSTQTRSMDSRQTKINNDYDNFIQRPFSAGKPKYKDYFKEDLAKNLNNSTRQLYIQDIEKEAIMYSCDICIEFDKKSDGLLTKDWKEHIASEVCDSIEELVREFQISNRKIVVTSVLTKMADSNKRNIIREVDVYYGR
jgi:hypothetical protein